jgi:hypothetical protein
MASARQKRRTLDRRRHHRGHHTIVPLFEQLADIAEGKRSMPETDAKYHHYVPQFHLRGFSVGTEAKSKNARIWQLDKLTGEIVERKIERVGGEPGFNRAVGPDGRSTNAIEAWLSIVEHHAAHSIREVLSAVKRPKYPDRVTLAFYIAIQELRTPDGLSRVQAASDFVMNAYVATWARTERSTAEMAREAGVDVEPEQISRIREILREPGAVRMNDPRTHALGIVLESAADLMNVISSMTWDIVTSEAALVIGDQPVIHHDAEPPVRPWIEPTWHSSTTSEGWLPLTSHLALKMTNPRARGERDFRRSDLAAEDAMAANLRSYGWATRYVFAESADLLRDLHAAASRDPTSVPRPSRPVHVITADRRAFPPSEPNVQPEGWPKFVPRIGQDGSIEWCRYRVVRHDDPQAIRDAVEWSLRAEQKLHPGARPRIELNSPRDIALMMAG